MKGRGVYRFMGMAERRTIGMGKTMSRRSVMTSLAPMVMSWACP